MGSGIGGEAGDVGVEAMVEWMTGEGSDIPDDYELHAGTCHSHIHAAEITEEADIACFIAAHE